MIALDAGTLIALFDPNDAHHARAVSLFEEAVDGPLYLSHVNHAEVLVQAVREQREEERYTDIERLGVSVLTPPPDAGVRLAQLRAATGLQLPDCCVILTALQSGSKIATFDARLARGAVQLGIEVVPAAAEADHGIRHRVPGSRHPG